MTDLTPSRKWWAATVTAAGTVGVAWIEAGFVPSVRIALIGLVVQRAVAWLTPNVETTVPKVATLESRGRRG